MLLQPSNHVQMPWRWLLTRKGETRYAVCAPTPATWIMVALRGVQQGQTTGYDNCAEDYRALDAKDALDCIRVPRKWLWQRRQLPITVSAPAHLHSLWRCQVDRQTHYRYNIKLHIMVRLPSYSLGNVEYSFITITLRSTLVVPARVPSMSQIELFNLLLRIIIYIELNCVE